MKRKGQSETGAKGRGFTALEQKIFDLESKFNRYSTLVQVRYVSIHVSHYTGCPVNIRTLANNKTFFWLHDYQKFNFTKTTNPLPVISLKLGTRDTLYMWNTLLFCLHHSEGLKPWNDSSTHPPPSARSFVGGSAHYSRGMCSNMLTSMHVLMFKQYALIHTCSPASSPTNSPACSPPRSPTCLPTHQHTHLHAHLHTK
jgi:hypothetical protein